MKIIHGDSLEVLKTLEENSVDSIVTDPPYGLSFMGKAWDHQVPSKELWAECLRVLKPGGHLLSFAGTRTQHRMAVNIEDAGFEIRDMIAWVYGSGFPKSHNIEKAINKIDLVQSGESSSRAKQWEGWGTALKPALEPITVARKPFKGTVASNVLEHGTGGLNIDGCRVETNDMLSIGSNNHSKASVFQSGKELKSNGQHPQGRFPANLIHDGSEEVVSLFPESNSGKGKAASYEKDGGHWGQGKQVRNADFGDSGSAARFFYCPKASKKDRNEGLDEFEEKDGIRTNAPRASETIKNPLNKNNHPTVKPTALMQYLVRLVTPPQGVVLDPFMGSGSTGKACKKEGFDFIGIDLEEEYCEIAKARINA